MDFDSFIIARFLLSYNQNFTHLFYCQSIYIYKTQNFNHKIWCYSIDRLPPNDTKFFKLIDFAEMKNVQQQT